MDGLIAPLDVAVVIVTYNRSALLDNLFKSLASMSRAPAKIIVIDNASRDDTQTVIDHASIAFPEGVVVNCLQSRNVGGAGGFSEGVKAALDFDVEWIWLIDDDVEVIENGLEQLMTWGDRFNCIHGQRLDASGQPFFFNPYFSEWLGVPLISFVKIGPGQHRAINSGCFEGMLVRSGVVRAIGPPDSRFFITWDDAIYGWMISKTTTVILTGDVVLKKTRAQRQISLGVRHLNDASDLFRYHVMRNRYLVAHYLRQAGCYNAYGFAIGTALIFAKEMLRLVAVERRIDGLRPLLRGYLDYRAKRNDVI